MDKRAVTYGEYDVSIPDWMKEVKLSLCLTKHHTIKSYWGVEV
jgi:hypothetical protein